MALPLPTLAQGAAASSCTSSPDMTTLTSRDPSALSLALHPHEADGTFNLTRLLLSLLTHLTRHLLQAQGISQRPPPRIPAGPDNGSERRRASGNPSLGRLALERDHPEVETSSAEAYLPSSIVQECSHQSGNLPLETRPLPTGKIPGPLLSANSLPRGKDTPSQVCRLSLRAIHLRNGCKIRQPAHRTTEQ